MIPYRRTAAIAACLWILSACAQATAVQAPATASPVPAPSTPTLAPTAGPTPSLPPYATPAWFKTAVLYQIFVRSFYDSNGDGIGDLRGITEKLDYIQSLGANTLWLTPIFASPSYHGYDTTDYYTINPDYGTKQDLLDLFKAAHGRGMHVILDYVASHTSEQIAFFRDAFANPKSQYSDWYIWKDAKHLNYQYFPGAPNLPSLNHATAAVNDYLIKVATYWMDPNGDGDFSDGIDGWRADYALGSPHGFWQQLRGAVKALNPNALLLGEVWVDTPSAQLPYYTDQFDSLFDFPLYISLMGAPETDKDGVLAGQSTAAIVVANLVEEHQTFPPQGIPVRFAGNHDTDRIATEVGGDPVRLRQTALLLATLDGTPMIYYGDELGMMGHKGSGPLYDEYRREPMDWFASATGAGETHWIKSPKYTLPNDGISVEEEMADSNSLLNYWRQVLKLRASNSALSQGAYQVLRADPPQGIVGFWRYTGQQIVSVVFNMGARPATTKLVLDGAPGPLAKTPVDLLTGQAVTIDPQKVSLEPGAALVLDWTAK